MFISLTSGIKAHGGVRQMWQGNRDSFRSWSGNTVCVFEALLQMEQGSSLSQLEWGRYITPKKAHKAHTNDLGKRPNKGVLLPMVLDNDEV